MAVAFLSHSSRDDDLVKQLHAWLGSQGFTDIFIDDHIHGGASWEDELRANAGSCRVVICFVTPNWLASSECPSEFKAAWYMGKRIIPLFLLGDAQLNQDQQAQLARVMAEAQGVDLTPFLTEAAAFDFTRDDQQAELIRKGLRAAGALADVGLDPLAFEIDTGLRKSPFPGLRAFGDEDADAALFFGRSREIAETLEWLRVMRTKPEQRALVILGASGAGKSSLLKAGIIPRLRREAPAWLPLRAFRPGADPLLNFAEAIALTLKDYHQAEAHGVIRNRLMEIWRAAEKQDGKPTPSGMDSIVTALETEASRLRTAANAPNATILISIDQAEELARGEGESASALADYLRAAMQAQTPFRLAFTIRTDSFPELQSHPRFRDLEARGYDLRTLPIFKFDDVVEAPAKRYGVNVDHDLIDQLMEDAPDRDALPLLAFALERMWDQFALSGKLTLKDYNAMGGLSGMIGDAADRALCGIRPDERDTPRPSARQRAPHEALGARTFVPALADINDDGAAIRRVAGWSEFDGEQQRLLDVFDKWRLVVRKADGATGDTVEVAHEALFREWEALKAWLEPERARLEALRGLKTSAAAWERSGRSADQLAHAAQRLKDIEELTGNERYAPQLTDQERDYVAACRKAENAATGRRRLLKLSAAVLGVGVVLGSLAYAFEFELRREWVIRTQVRPHVLSSNALNALQAGEAFRECGAGFDCAEMKVLPAGTFLMGSPDDEPGRDYDEGPQQEISIQRFAVGRFEVTHDQWEACVEHTDRDRYEAQEEAGEPVIGCAKAGDQGYGRVDKPVINVSWEDAQGYVRWLNLMTEGKTEGPYRLLTEAEWEYAARGETQSAYYWGDSAEEICGYANVMTSDTKRKYTGFRGAPAQCEDGFIETAPVGSFKPNAFGLFDMSGNVWEWTEDCYRGNLEDQSPDGEAWEAGDCSRRVLRGGSWNHNPRSLRSADRYVVYSGSRSVEIGFRLARTL